MGKEYDELAKALALGVSRRQALWRLLVAGVGGLATLVLPGVVTQNASAANPARVAGTSTPTPTVRPPGAAGVPVPTPTRTPTPSPFMNQTTPLNQRGPLNQTTPLH